jgi:hypothetical protein
MSKVDKPDASARLNVLALPSQTAILFALIFLVIGVPVLFSAVGRSVPCGPVVIVCVVTLTTWDFLSAPDRQIRQLRLENARTDFPTLTKCVEDLATATAGLLNPPYVFISSENDGISSFGTFTRRYMSLSRHLAEEMERTLASSVPFSVTGPKLFCCTRWPTFAMAMCGKLFSHAAC